MTPHLRVISQGECNFLDLVGELTCRCEDQPLAPPDIPIDALQNPNDKGCCLSCARLCLANGVPAIKYRFYSTLLNRTRLLEAVGIDPTKQVLIEVIVIKGLEDWILLSTCDGHTLGRHAFSLQYLCAEAQADSLS